MKGIRPVRSCRALIDMGDLKKKFLAPSNDRKIGNLQYRVRVTGAEHGQTYNLEPNVSFKLMFFSALYDLVGLILFGPRSDSSSNTVDISPFTFTNENH